MKKTARRVAAPARPATRPIPVGPPASTPPDLKERLRRAAAQFEGIGLPAGDIGRLARDGTQFNGAARLRDDPVLAAYYRRRRPQAKQCFWNTQTFLIWDDAGHAEYFEGYFTSFVGGRVVLVHHGWLVRGGVVYDPTHGPNERLYHRMTGAADFTPLAHLGYVGVPVPRRAVCRQCGAGWAKPLLDLPAML